MSEALPTEEDLLRRALFVPCRSKEDLHRWICVYLGLNLPETIVDPESTSSPMDMVWEVYDEAMRNDNPDFSRVMAYASRDSMKTLGAAILEVLSVVHMDRDVAHMAAIRPQAQKAQSYVKQMFRLPYLRDYVTSSNTEKLEFVRYHNPETGDNFTKDQYDALLESDKRKFQEHGRYIKIVICSMQGANSDHVPFMVVDEVDVIPKQNQAAYEEAKSIPAMFEEKEPITLLVSTRKFAFGNVQRELNNAVSTGLVVRHWNIIDCTQACPPSRHLPEEPRIPIWFSRDDFSAIGQEQYDALPPERQSKYDMDQGYSGCLKKCKLFAMCRGNLATRQKQHPVDEKGKYTERPRPLLKSIRFTTNKFNQLSRDMAKAQLMCWAPSSEGLIYTNLNREKHFITPAQVAEIITADPYPEAFTYQQLMEMVVARGGKFVAGVDFGMTHNFSVVLIYVEANRGFIVGHWSQPELDPAEKIDLLDRTIKPFEPTVFPDTASPDMIKFLKKHGYKCKDWQKLPGSVLGGIEIVRYKLTPGIVAEPQLFFVAGAPGIEEIWEAASLYHWALGPDGKPTDEPDEDIAVRDDGVKILDDSMDAMRYAVMNTFHNKGKVLAAKEDAIIPGYGQVKSAQDANKAQNQAWAKEIMEHVMGPNDDPLEFGSGGETGVKGKKGGFFFDL